eukprot:4360948-Amphidinium_carterae.2
MSLTNQRGGYAPHDRRGMPMLTATSCRHKQVHKCFELCIAQYATTRTPEWSQSAESYVPRWLLGPGHGCHAASGPAPRSHSP